MAKQRKSRSIEKERNKDLDLFKPLNLKVLGSDDDPCFGKLYDLVAPECKVCGDSEFCSIITAQNLKIRNLEMEAEKRFKDVEEGEKNNINKRNNARKLIQEYQKRGLNKFKILIKVSKETNLSKDEVKQLL